MQGVPGSQGDDFGGCFRGGLGVRAAQGDEAGGVGVALAGAAEEVEYFAGVFREVGEGLQDVISQAGGFCFGGFGGAVFAVGEVLNKALPSTADGESPSLEGGEFVCEAGEVGVFCHGGYGRMFPNSFTS